MKYQTFPYSQSLTKLSLFFCVFLPVEESFTSKLGSSWAGIGIIFTTKAVVGSSLICYLLVLSTEHNTKWIRVCTHPPKREEKFVHAAMPMNHEQNSH